MMLVLMLTHMELCRHTFGQACSCLAHTPVMHAIMSPSVGCFLWGVDGGDSGSMPLLQVLAWGLLVDTVGQLGRDSPILDPVLPGEHS